MPLIKAEQPHMLAGCIRLVTEQAADLEGFVLVEALLLALLPGAEQLLCLPQLAGDSVALLA